MTELAKCVANILSRLIVVFSVWSMSIESIGSIAKDKMTTANMTPTKDAPALFLVKTTVNSL